ncbi:hypothetical protein MMC31_005193, partial [Peltigera leucophlebia]|nr:hypothetical protein [Peltigera leucophlebia]
MSDRVHTVAVIGAGVSGLSSALHLRAAGLEVTVYERSSAPGGIWLYDERTPPEPEYPCASPPMAEGFFKEHEDHSKSQDIMLDVDQKIFAQIENLHAPPGPCYEGLHNNVSTTLLEMKNHPWPAGTPDFIHHRHIKAYLDAVAQMSSTGSSYLYNTKVERVWKTGARWRIQSTLLTFDGITVKNSRCVRDFDAVVVATGHYDACKIPDIPGLGALKRSWPDRISHSKSYRKPDGYKNQNVLLIGARVSSTDIARELGPFAKNIYQSSRGSLHDLPKEKLPKNGTRVSAVSSFDNITGHDGKHTSSVIDPTLNEKHPLPGINLKDGTKLDQIHEIIFCTGYHISYPFLPPLPIPPSSSSLGRDTNNGNSHLLITDGTMTHNLHKDIFYIPDPTLSFIGVPFDCATFSLFEFQAIALAAAYAGRARLPTEEAMRAEYNEKLRRK